MRYPMARVLTRSTRLMIDNFFSFSFEFNLNFFWKLVALIRILILFNYLKAFCTQSFFFFLFFNKSAVKILIPFSAASSSLLFHPSPPPPPPSLLTPFPLYRFPRTLKSLFIYYFPFAVLICSDVLAWRLSSSLVK